MATSTLITHCGSRVVSRDELDAIEAPPPTKSWFPIKHAIVVDTVTQALTDGGFQIRQTKVAMSPSNARMFTTFDLETPLAGGDVTLAVGARNSCDKTFPLSFCAGERVTVCDNLAFQSELIVTRKHTRFGADRFREAICESVRSLWQFQQSESARIRQFQAQAITPADADSIMLRSFEKGIISHYLLPRVIREFREPSHPEFAANGLTFWRLEQAFTTVLGSVEQSNPHRFCAVSLAIQGLLSQAAGLPSEPQLVTPA